MRASTVRSVAAVLLVLYTVVVVRLTLLPAGSETSTFGALDDAVTWLTSGGLDWTQIEALANVALFVPAGFLVAVVLRRCWAAVVLCALASGGIEWAQSAFLPSRVPSLADVEHNSLGGLLGALVAWPLVAWLRRSARTAAAARAAAVAGRVDAQPVMPVSAPSRMR